MLQHSAVTGFFFLLGIAVHSSAMAWGAALASALSFLAAHWLGAKQVDIENGLYGFNGALVGIAVVYFFPLSLSSAALLVGGSIASSMVMKLMLSHFKLPAFTAPFVIVTWMLLGIGNLFGLERATSLSGKFMSLDLPLGSLTGIGQVMFQENPLSGFLFFLGIFACSRTQGIWSLAGSALGGAFGFLIGQSQSLIMAGLFGYNASLAAIALSTRQRYAPFLGIIASVLILLLFWKLGFAALTAPFVLASWLVLAFCPKNIGK